MCQGIALSIDELPEALLRAQQHRIILREPGTSREVRFLCRDPRPELPVWHDSRLIIYPWGTQFPSPRHGVETPLKVPSPKRWNQKGLPQTAWCRREDLEAGQWRHLYPSLVEIPATLGWEKGVWFLVPEGGLRGVLAYDASDRPHAYLLTQPASHYYQIMTRSPRMPVFVGRQM